MALTDAQIERLAHYSYLLGVRLMFEAFEIEVVENNPRGRKMQELLEKIAEGDTAVLPPTDIPMDPRLEAEISVGDMIADDRHVAGLILRDQDRMNDEIERKGLS